MLLGGETQIDSFISSPSSNGNASTPENESNNAISNQTPIETLSNVNILQNSSTSSAQVSTINEEFKVSPKDTNQNFLQEANVEMYQTHHQTHVGPRVQPYDLNIAHQQVHHHHRSNSHLNHYSNGGTNRKLQSSPYKNLNNLNHQNAIYEGVVSSSSNNNDLMVLKEEPENGY
jgi:hypothetical protein